MQDSPGSVFFRFLRFGALAWGGPAAQIGRLEQEVAALKQRLAGLGATPAGK